MNIKSAILLLAASTIYTPVLFAESGKDHENAIITAVESFRPGTTGFGAVKTRSIDINNKKRTITIDLNSNAAYIPFTAESLKELKDECRSIMGSKYSRYKISISADSVPLERLVRYAAKKNTAPKEKQPFIVNHDKAAAPDGLDGANIALWQSHGWYFEPKLNRWEWQRARIFQTVEDLYTQSYVMPFLMPMLENAGAYVMSPRERDTSRTEIIADNDNSAFTKGAFSTTGNWEKADAKGFAYTKAELRNGDHPFAEGSALKAPLSGNPDKSSATATWKAAVPADGNYAVYVGYATLPNSTDKAQYTVHAADGAHKFTVNQQMGGGTWIYLGHFPFRKNAGESTVVELSNAGKDKRKAVTADAVKIGGGMGNVARAVKEPLDSINYEYVTSGYPRFVEGARYFMQWAGAPDSVFTPSGYVNDYTDDYRSRALWVNWLTSGSSMAPDRKGLNIPVDLSFAFHSDAGTTRNDSIIGTLGIYCTQGETTGNGSSRMASRDLTDEVMANIVNDVRAQFEPKWTRRGMWDKSYYEARVPEVPAMLLELLSHQNFADMAYGLDPAFRFTVSRAIYKGMLKYLAQRDGRPYVVQPLPARSFAIEKAAADNSYTLSWAETVDSLESSATPTYYIIEERIDNGAFKNIGTTTETTYTVTVDDDAIHSYRIIAANSGGVAFPSETLALCNTPGAKGTVTIVNGFTRISAPDRFDSGEIAGFYDVRDHGVPYISDISFIGSQFEFRRDIPWMDDDAAGFGASRANYEDKVIAGNTFDYPYIHGTAIKAAGYSFVSSSVEAFSNGSTQPQIVDLILGKQKEIVQGRGVYGTRFKTYPDALQNRLSNVTAQGCDVFVSGAYVATDLWDNPYSTDSIAQADKEFARKVLGYNWRVGQASVTGEAYQVPTRFKYFGKGEYQFSNTLNEECYAVESPDSFFPADSKKGCTFMRYSENNLVAGTLFDNDIYRTAVIGFPFETIMTSAEREHLMKQILDFFSDPEPLRKHATHIE